MEEKNLILEEIEKNKDKNKISNIENIIYIDFRKIIQGYIDLNNKEFDENYFNELFLNSLENINYSKSPNEKINIFLSNLECIEKNNKEKIIINKIIDKIIFPEINSINNIDFNGEIEIRNKKYNLYISDCNINKITINSDCKNHNQNINIDKIDIKNSIIKDLNIISEGKLKIYNQELIIENSVIENGTLKGTIAKNGNKGKTIINYNNDFNDIDQVININFKKIDDIDKISIYSEKDLERTKFNIKFENIRFNSNPNSYYYLARLKLENLEFENCSNFSEIFKINNLETDNLVINDFILGKMVINGLKIKNQLKLKNPVLNETIFNNVEFPKNDIKIAGEENSTNYGEIKEYYIQLKNVMDNSGNHIQADKFFAKEMEYYGKSLKGEKGQFWNKLVYYIQKGISDFGNDWTLPVLWMINLGNLNIIFKEKYYFTLFYILIFGFFYYILHTSFGLFKEQSDFKKIIKNILIIIVSFLLFNIFYYFYFQIFIYIIFENSIEILNYLDTFANTIKPLDILNVTSDITFFGLLYKVILAILIYHLIISLKRLTKR